MRYSHKEYPRRRALSSGRVDRIYTMRCLTSNRLEGWTGAIHHRVGNQGKVWSTGAWLPGDDSGRRRSLDGDATVPERVKRVGKRGGLHGEDPR